MYYSLFKPMKCMRLIQRNVFFQRIFTTAQCYKLIRMCQPQSVLWCFRRPSPHPRTRITNFFPSSLLTFDWSIRSFGYGFISHQQSHAFLYNTRGEFHSLVKANFASELLAEIWGIVWLLDIGRKISPRKCPEEKIPRTDWSSYLRRCLRAEFVCKVRY